MKFNYMVKFNGVFYKAGEEVPNGTSSKADEKPEQKVEIKEPEYTKEKIQKMKVAELKKLAQDNGVDNADELTGSELKEILIDKLV